MKKNKINLLPLDKFIDNSLYNKKTGFYMNNNPFGEKGDFITAPNISILFSEMIFVWIYSIWEKFNKPNKINFVELGAGNGEMLFQILNTSKKFEGFINSFNFFVFEKSEYLEKIQKKKLKDYKVTWLKDLNKIPDSPTIFIANEFFDALPIKQFIKIKKTWYEKYIKYSKENIKFINKKTNIKKIESKFGIKLSANQNFIEFSPLAYYLLKKISNEIKSKNGGLLIIDYGSKEKKMKNTLHAIKNHKRVSLLKNNKNVDITYNLNFELIDKIINKFDLKLNGYTNQKKFLINLGILERAEILAKNLKFSEKANIYSRLTRLIDEKLMGDLFKVAFISKKKDKFNIGFK